MLMVDYLQHRVELEGRWGVGVQRNPGTPECAGRVLCIVDGNLFPGDMQCIRSILVLCALCPVQPHVCARRRHCLLSMV